MATSSTEVQEVAENIIEYCLKDIVAHEILTVTHSEHEVLQELSGEEIMERFKKERDIQPKSKVKLFNDSIHGSMLLNPLEVAIINTPEFYRLRDIKQLGGKSHVYPGAVHTRFEHSIGVCYLAGEFVKHLRQAVEDIQLEESEKKINDIIENLEQISANEERESLEPVIKKLKKITKNDLITEKQELCIRLAGLCHDLGHGPFSHVFDQVKKEILREEQHKKIKHERISVLMFKKILLEQPKVLAHFVYYGLNVEHVELIGYMIDCSQEFMKEKKSEEKDEVYLYEIVANKVSGVDVDKWDYFARDCNSLGVLYDFDYRRCMMLSRVVKCSEDQASHIAFRDKEISNIYGMFRTRCIIHQKACTHKVVSAIEMMIKDAMVLGKDLKLYKFHETQKSLQLILDAMTDRGPTDLSGYVHLTDDILKQIWHYPDKNEKAPELVNRIIMRKCYVKVSEEIVYPSPSTREKLTKEERKKLKTLSQKKSECGKYEIECASISYASEETEDPVEVMHFYGKDIENEMVPELECKKKPPTSYITIPKSFVEVRLRLFRKEGNRDKDDSTWKWFKNEVDEALKIKDTTG